MSVTFPGSSRYLLNNTYICSVIVPTTILIPLILLMEEMSMSKQKKSNNLILQKTDLVLIKKSEETKNTEIYGNMHECLGKLPLFIKL